MPDGHRRAMPQVTAVDELFGTHRLAVDSRFLRHGIEPALSADATAMAPGDMFSQMRVAFACGRGE